MDDSARSWHHGLIARWWAETKVAQTAELDYYRAAIERFGQPALDVACGTGRLLLPLLAEGIDIEGADISADMLAQCRAMAGGMGLQPRLHEQAVHELDLPRRYRTIYICDSFGIGGSRPHDRQGLRRMHDLLEPGGGLVFSHEPPYADVDEWSLWTAQGASALPGTWPESGQRKAVAGGEEIELIARTSGLDPLEQRVTYEMRARLWRGPELVQQEQHSLTTNLYLMPEILLMLEEAGFTDLRAETAYSGQPATRDSRNLVFVAAKKA